MSQQRLGDPLSVEAPGYTRGYWNKTNEGDRLVLGIWALLPASGSSPCLYSKMAILPSRHHLKWYICVKLFCVHLDHGSFLHTAGHFHVFYCVQLQMRVIESMRLCISTTWSCTHLLGVPEAKKHKLDGTGLLPSLCISVFKHQISRVFRAELGYSYFYAWLQIHAPLLSWCTHERSPRNTLIFQSTMECLMPVQLTSL